MTLQKSEKLVQLERPEPKKIKFVDFVIEKEQWNRYILEDKSRLKGRFVLFEVIFNKTIDEIKRELKTLRPDQPLKLGFGFKGHRLYSAEPPPNLRRTPDQRKYSAEELKASIVKRDIDFETVKSTWNSYKLKNGMIFKCRLSPTTVNRTNKFDDSGMPIYLIDSNLDVKVTLPPDLEKILEKREKAQK